MGEERTVDGQGGVLSIKRARSCKATVPTSEADGRRP
jgi:hypothetical protein